MTKHPGHRRDGVAPVVWTLGFAAVWLITAIAIRPGATLHLGPVIVPLVPMMIASASGQVTTRWWWTGSAAAAGTLLVLWGSGNLSGPPIRPFTGADLESLVLLLAGAAAAAVLAISGRRRQGERRRVQHGDPPIAGGDRP